MLLFVVLFAPTTHADLARYRDLVVADATERSRPGENGIRVTYLGVNGYQLEAGEHALLIDPYFSRVSFWQVAAGQRLQPNAERVSAGLTHVRPRVDAVLVTHAHFDHLLDVPALMGRVTSGDRKTIGPWKIAVLAAQHYKVLGSSPPHPGVVPIRATPPTKPSDWKLGEPLAFVIEANGQRIYIESGGVPGASLPRVGKIDLAILGGALPDSRRRFASVVRTLQPRYILPSHQDDFFVPFDRGFSFGKLTNFPQVLRAREREALPGRLILLDYFRPWTLR